MTATAPSPGPAAALARAWRTARWFIDGVLGANAYQHYLVHHRRHGHDEPLSEREFWKAEYARQGRAVNARCC
ncbi:YbdD/YjiX family protein [Nigerium massiliense]|uniref:YbdD/YjiX family protein n=1 Tax=Nigerium massiliense TaxID=1522317 RepID=UPI00058FB9CE|nr:YbdD/YjiX family protein [Nigerium massiliense]